MLVSVHLPKTAGTSFLRTLEEHFGHRLRKDYDDRPINRSSLARNSRALYQCAANSLGAAGLEGVECIHGHFLPLKYRLLRVPGDKQFVTWMREPVARLVSHYHYWKRSFDPLESAALHRRVVEEDWSLERFCLGPELRNVYSKFLWGFPLARFSFIGITEHYEADISYFCREFLKETATPVRENISPPGEKDALLEDVEFCARVESHHSADVALYRQALAARSARPPVDSMEGRA